MTAKFFALLTNQGAAKLANATALGTKLQITQMGVGDGGGTLPTPTGTQTKLVNEKRRGVLNALSVDAANSSQIIAEQIIPENEGGFWIREIGLYDSDNTLIAVANCPETYKPMLAEGSGRTQTVRMILIINSTDAVTLKVDPSVVLATRQYADDKVIEAKAYADDAMAKHVAAEHPHKQYALAEAVSLALSAKLAKDQNGADIPDKAAFLENVGVSALLTGVVGASRNARMSVTGVSSSATFTADELIVQSALGGRQYKIANFNKAVSLTSVGAGGLDAGAAPVNGFVALYAIFNPLTGACALLAANATAATAPEVYGGSKMPTGYSSSALVSIWPTNENGKFKVAGQSGRRVFFRAITVLSTAGEGSANPFTPFTIAAAAPRNAKDASLTATIGTNTSSESVYSSVNIAADGGGAGSGTVTVSGASGGNIASSVTMIIPILTPQTLYQTSFASTGSTSYSVTVSSYQF